MNFIKNQLKIVLLLNLARENDFPTLLRRIVKFYLVFL